MELTESLKSKYKINDESLRFLDERMKMMSSGEALTKEAYERNHIELNAGLEFEFVGTVKEFFVPSLTVPGGVPIDAIKPKGCPPKPGIIIHFHGGANTFGSRKTTDLMCKVLATELKCVVVNVEYRLAPEHKFPAMFDDGKCVTRWVLMNKSLIGAEYDSKVGVCGSSAGGGIAATIAFEVPALDFQILVYPFVDWRIDGENYKEHSEQELAFLKKLVDESLQSPADVNNIRASPLLQPNFARLPPTLLIIAEVDQLKESILAFKSQLKAANVTCESKLMKGVVHGFFSQPGFFKETNGQCREIIAKFFKKNGTY